MGVGILTVSEEGTEGGSGTWRGESRGPCGTTITSPYGGVGGGGGLVTNKQECDDNSDPLNISSSKVTECQSVLTPPESFEF